jgi:hypothetical protein
MKTESDYEALKAEVKAEFPDFKVVNKHESGLMKVIDVALRVITFGQLKQFMSNFITTVGTTVYVFDGWDDRPVTARMEILRHERVHMRQVRKYGRFLFSVMYLLLPLPTVFAHFRKKFEQEAYEESLRALQEYHGDAVLKDPIVKEQMIAHFTSAQYFWTWPWTKSISGWYDDTVKRLLSKFSS